MDKTYFFFCLREWCRELGKWVKVGMRERWRDIRWNICWVGPCAERNKKKKSSTFYITATLNNMINRVHLSCVEGHPTQAVISDQAWINKEEKGTAEFLRFPWILSQIPWWSVNKSLKSPIGHSNLTDQCTSRNLQQLPSCTGPRQPKLLLSTFSKRKIHFCPL